MLDGVMATYDPKQGKKMKASADHHVNHSLNDAAAQAERQGDPHSHAIVLEPYYGRIVLVPDLGTDEVRQYVFDAQRGILSPVGKLDCGPRDLGPHGPRYLEFDPIADAALVSYAQRHILLVDKVDHLKLFPMCC